jgi:lipid II isoglutaminyl synthase (glutamine-hydrolysing)
MTAVRLCHLYPGEMNIYADRGNIAVLRQRLEWRGLSLEITEVGLGESPDPAAHDMYYLGGGQDRDQAVVAEDLARHKADALHAAAGDGAVILAVCGGYQLAGHGYTALDGSRMPGIGLLDVDTIAGTTRLIGNISIEAELDGETAVIAGFENHAGRTHRGPGCRALGRVVRGHGNDGADGTEGAVRDHVVGTYLHGPLLPRNPWLADTLLRWALEHNGRPADLSPLDDTLEREAHRVALGR